MKKYFIIFTVLFLSLICPQTFAAEPILDVILPSGGFTDIPDNYWAYPEIRELYRLGIMSGYPDGNFYPDKSITREEFATAAIKSLGLQDEVVWEPLKFDDFYERDWAWNYVQLAYVFGLLTPPRPVNGEYLFRPEDSILRCHAISIAVNAIKTLPINDQKAKAVLDYEDTYELPNWFLKPAAKAQLLDMLVIDPRKPQRLIEYDKPITRAETAVLLFDMIEEAKTNPNEKIKKAMNKKISAYGHVLQDAYIEDEVIAVIPKGTILPLVVTEKFSSQKAIEGQKYTALVPKNFIHNRKYLLLENGTKFHGHLKKVNKGRLFTRNGEIIFENDTIEARKQPSMKLQAIADVTNKNNNKLFRKIFKASRVRVDRGEFLELKLLQDLKIDVTNGKLLEQEDL